MNELKEQATYWAKNELIPFLDDGESFLGLPVDRLVLAMLARRAAKAGIDLDFMVQEVKHHYKHQIDFIKQNSH